MGPRSKRGHLPLLGPRRSPILESNEEGEMPVLMRQDQRFDHASAAFERLSKIRGRGGFQHAIAFGQPATIKHLEPLSTERTSGSIELGRAEWRGVARAMRAADRRVSARALVFGSAGSSSLRRNTSRGSVPSRSRASRSRGSSSRSRGSSAVRGSCSSHGRTLVRQTLPCVAVCDRSWQLESNNRARLHHLAVILVGPLLGPL